MNVSVKDTNDRMPKITQAVEQHPHEGLEPLPNADNCNQELTQPSLNALLYQVLFGGALRS